MKYMKMVKKINIKLTYIELEELREKLKYETEMNF